MLSYEELTHSILLLLQSLTLFLVALSTHWFIFHLYPGIYIYQIVYSAGLMTYKYLAFVFTDVFVHGKKFGTAAAMVVTAAVQNVV